MSIFLSESVSPTASQFFCAYKSFGGPDSCHTQRWSLMEEADEFLKTYFLWKFIFGKYRWETDYPLSSMHQLLTRPIYSSASAISNAKCLTIGFQVSLLFLHKKFPACITVSASWHMCDVTVTRWWHSVYARYQQFHETSTPVPLQIEAEWDFRLAATSNSSPCALHSALHSVQIFPIECYTGAAFNSNVFHACCWLLKHFGGDFCAGVGNVSDKISTSMFDKYQNIMFTMH